MLNTLSKTRYFEIVRIWRNRSLDAVFIKNFIEFVFDNLELIEYKCLIYCSTGGTSIRDIAWAFGSIRIPMWRRNSGNSFRFFKTNGFPTIIFPFIPNYIGFGWNSVKMGWRWLSENLWSSIYGFRLPFDWLPFIRFLCRDLLRKMILWFTRCFKIKNKDDTSGALFTLSLSPLILISRWKEGARYIIFVQLWNTYTVYDIREESNLAWIESITSIIILLGLGSGAIIFTSLSMHCIIIFTLSNGAENVFFVIFKVLINF